MKRVRGFVFTKFKKHGPDPPIWNEDKMRWLIFAPETCPTTNKFHWQGYVFFKAARTLSAVIKDKDFGNVEIAIKDAATNKVYCEGPYHNEKEKKDKPYNPDFIEHGEMPKKGERRDLNELKTAIADGLSVDTICMDNPELYHKYGRTLTKLEDIALRRRFRTKMTECDWLWGSTGTGKSHRAFQDFDPETHYVWKDDNGWQDGYTGQTIVIINDFRGSIKFGEMLQLIDKWPYTVSRRGREPAPFLAEKIIITACAQPKDIYINVATYDENGFDQLLRRINVIEIKHRCIQ